jgi:hypothetical protein
MIIAPTDFVGKYALSQGIYNTPDYQYYIDKYEPKYLKELLGIDLYNEFNADLILGAGVPTEPRFITIFEPLDLGLIYFEIVRDFDNQITPIGNVSPKGENSDKVRSYNSTMWQRYNEGITSFRAIQCYILKEREDYNLFNGKNKLYATWL